MSDYLTQDTPLYMWGPYDPDGLQDSLSIIKKERTKERKKRKRKNQKGKKKKKKRKKEKKKEKRKKLKED